MKRQQAVKNIREAVEILRRVREEYLRAKGQTFRIGLEIEWLEIAANDIEKDG